MRNVFKKLAVGAGALALAATFGLTVFAQQGPPEGRPGRPGGPGPRAGAMALGFALGQLDLSDAQREQVRAIVQRHREEQRTLATQTRTARRALDQAAEAPTVDEAAIRTAAGTLAEAEAQMALMRARVRAEVLEVLTPEQRAKAEALKGQMRQRMQERGARAVPPPPQ
jgi:protein CpxP